MKKVSTEEITSYIETHITPDGHMKQGSSLSRIQRQAGRAVLRF